MAADELTNQGKPVDERVEAFRRTIAPDLHEVAEFVPWDAVAGDIDARRDAIESLQVLVDTGSLTQDDLASVLASDPGAVIVLNHLFVTPNGAGFRDGREIPASGPLDMPTARKAASAALELGLRQLLPTGARVVDLYRVGALAIDARRRGYRRRDTLESRVRRLIDQSVLDADTRTGLDLSRLVSGQQPAAVRGRAREVIAADDHPVAAIATVFQSSSGGRQQRDLSFTYPRLQEELDAVPMTLLLIADGKGIAEAPTRVLETLLDAVPACMTVEQAEQGALAQELASAAVNRGARTTRRFALRTIITSALDRRPSITADELPAPPETARLALSEYVSDHPERALELEADGRVLSWRSKDVVADVQSLADTFSSDGAARAFATSLGLDLAPVETDAEEPDLLMAEVRGDAVLPERLVVSARATDSDEEIVRAVARAARHHVAGAALAVLLVPDAESWRIGSSARIQRSMATSVVVIDRSDLLAIVGAASPRDALVGVVLRQADLTKANPFNATGATRPEMFYGRHVEESDLISALDSNSAALLGGRRIGKTSLLQRVITTLESAGQWAPFYADLQEVGDWLTFAQHVALRWDVDLPDQFAPANLSLLVEQLEGRAGQRVVVALDEVDDLLRWDQDHAGRHVSEAFFRACRALSQEGRAQFVFSGERVIAERLWDARSPHWNFCRPVPVRQLTRDAADALLADPLASLGVALEEAAKVLDLSWSRTNGHPHIVQYLGEALVRWLNDQDPDARTSIDYPTVEATVSSVEFARHYAVTYWGQASVLEKAVSALVSTGTQDLGSLRDALGRHGAAVDAETLAAAVRILDLYGVLEDAEEPLRLRATWLPRALEAFGGADAVLNDQLEQLQRPTVAA